MHIEISSVQRCGYTDKPTPVMEITAENPGTVVMKIRHDGEESEFVEVGTLNLIHALLAIGGHDLHENVAHDRAYRDLQNTALRDYWKREKKTEG